MTMQLSDRHALNEPLRRRFAITRGDIAPVDIADGALLAALPPLAVALTGSPALVTALPAAAWLPWLLLGVIAGIVVDRAHRRGVGMAGLAARSVLLLGATVVATSGQPALWPLIGAAAAASGLTLTLLTGSPRTIRRPALPVSGAGERIARHARAHDREEAAAAHRARATDRLLLSGLHHLR